MRSLGKFDRISTITPLVVIIDELEIGINSLADHIIYLENDKSVKYIIDKVCDHAGGRLILKDEHAICPMHNWSLNLNSLTYNDSHVCKHQLKYELTEEGHILLNKEQKHLVNRFKTQKKGIAKLRWINHACVFIECNGVKILTDPWLFGPAFLTGWWLAEPSPADAIELLKSVDLIYISHNHPDHLHAETLSLVAKDKPIVTANFHSSSARVMLEKLGFTKIFTPDFYEVIELAENFQFSILKSGDFRDDSGIYIHANGHEFLFAVDSNFLNSHILPQNVDLFMTSFAGGASGFPLCYEKFSEDEKLKIIKRSRNSIKAKVINYVKACKPKYFMPYAGMFAEYAGRDKYILERNYKIKQSDYVTLLKNHDTEVLFADSSSTLIFNHDGLKFKRNKNVEKLKVEDHDFYIDNLKAEYTYDSGKVIQYLQQSEYVGHQILQIIPTDDDFEKIVGDIIYVDFSLGFFKTIVYDELIDHHSSKRVMKMKVRAEILMCIIENYLPWEDFLIGFQMRATRYPNEYESDFWYHFTNIYVAKENFKYSSYCGSCTVIDQNPIWI